MEFVGKVVKKEFKGFGFYSGIVKSYDSSSGFFEVQYEDGDSEELDLSEVSSLLEGQVELVEERSCRGRKPKKRQRVENKQEFRDGPGSNVENLVTVKLNYEETLERGLPVSVSGRNEKCMSNDGFGENLEAHWVGGNLKGSIEGSGNLNLNVDPSGSSEDNLEIKCGFNDFKGKMSVNGHSITNNCLGDFDLNQGLDFSNGCGLPNRSDENMYLKRDGSIDLNLDAYGDFDENTNGVDIGCSAVEIEKRGCDFDLNMEINDGQDASKDCGREVDDSSFGIVEESQEKDGENLEENFNESRIENWTLTEIQIDFDADQLMKSSRQCPKNAFEDASSVAVEQMQKDLSVSCGDETANALVGVSDVNFIDDNNLVDIELKDGLSETCITAIAEYQNIEIHCNQRSSRRKRRKLLDDPKHTPEKALRRSTRRGSSKMHVLTTSFAADDSSAASKEKQLISGCKPSEKPIALPPQLPLPPSSQNLNLDDIPILDIFSIYACLRSFSTLLFLSPFELEDFVAALRCTSPSSLFDYINVSILQILRKHLEYLSMEGSESASNCLRSLNWDFLDVITWPLYMVEYLLMHGSSLKPGFDLTHLQLFELDYYKLPTSIKVEILRCLCDDMIEAEAIRSEINRRSLAAESEIILDRSMKFEVYKKKKAHVDVSGSPCLTEDVLDDTTDWNSDECCLCKMDGNLICCDGCPAAYHTKCVGIVNDLLPEGDWHCPECAIDRCKPWMKPQKSIRGAELLGTDHHGRLYYSSCGYLLVLYSCDSEPSFNYYHRNDLIAVIEALRSSYVFDNGLIMAIYKHWDIPFSLNYEGSELGSLNCTSFSDKPIKGETPTTSAFNDSLRLYDFRMGRDDTNCRKFEDNSVAGYYGNDSEVAKSINGSVVTIQESALSPKLNLGIENHHEHKSYNTTEFFNQAEIPGRIPSGEDSSLTLPGLDGRQENNIESAGNENGMPTITIGRENTLKENGHKYVNLYAFAQTASSIANELMSLPPHKTNEKTMISEEEITEAQTRAILKKATRCRPIIHNFSVAVQKEKCGWCFSCKALTDDNNCLFNMIIGPFAEGSKADKASLQLRRNQKGHLTDLIYQLLSIEGRLRGLLLGPWLNPYFTKLWRENISKTSVLTSVKHFLLTLESNLHHLAISSEWLKHIDSAVTMGSASHFTSSSLRMSSKNGILRKRARCSDIEFNSSSNAASGLGMFWWRGGKLSRHMFNWKVLPRSLASRAARRAGCTKIPGILYPEGSEYAKRSRCTAWRAAVETSTSVEQLAFQVRELDSNIKWEDVENTHPLSTLDKESRKSNRLFKKAVIRRKFIEGNMVKYLLDFGKRRAIPDVVKNHGTLLEEVSNERKKYWLDVSHVPLHLVKNFEEKRVARKSNEVKSTKLMEGSGVKSRLKKGFEYLFLKAERSEFYQCGHCNKDVPAREAVSCQDCKGFFHKRHVKKFSDSVNGEWTYACHRCRGVMSLKIGGKKLKIHTREQKVQTATYKKPKNDRRSSLRVKTSKKFSRTGRPVQTQNKKVSAGVPLRRSARKAKCLSLQKKKQYKKVGRPRKNKRIQSRKGAYQKQKTPLQKKRTPVEHSYWINGLHLSGRPNDERVHQFREKRILEPSQDLSAILEQPKCHLCSETGYTSTLNYVACEICGGWFHGDAFGLDLDKINKLIGFRCHVCRKRNPPVCSSLLVTKSDKSVKAELQNNDVV